MYAAIVEATNTRSHEMSLFLFGEYKSKDVFMREIKETGARPHGTDEFFIREPENDLSLIIKLVDVGSRTKKSGVTVPINPAIPYRHKMISERPNEGFFKKVLVPNIDSQVATNVLPEWFIRFCYSVGVPVKLV